MTATPTPIPACANCEFSIVFENLDTQQAKLFGGKERVRICRRYPPQWIANGAKGTTYFPVVADVTWCGEFMPVAVTTLPHIVSGEVRTPTGIAEEMHLRQQPRKE